MENLVPGLDAFNIPMHGNAIVVNNVDAIAVGVLPTDEQILREIRRLDMLRRAREGGWAMTDADYSAAIIRVYKVVHAKAGVVAGPAFDQQLAALIADMNGRFQQVNGRIDQVDAHILQLGAQNQATIDNRFNEMQDEINQLSNLLNDHIAAHAGIVQGQINTGINQLQVDSAQQYQALLNRVDLADALATANARRMINLSLANDSNDGTAAWRPTPFALIPKYLRGHPPGHRPSPTGLGFVWGQAAYELNSEPPANLLPANRPELQIVWSELTANERMRKMRCLFWFYNDPRFEPPNNNVSVEEFNTAVYNFLRYP